MSSLKCSNCQLDIEKEALSYSSCPHKFCSDCSKQLKAEDSSSCSTCWANTMEKEDASHIESGSNLVLNFKTVNDELKDELIEEAEQTITCEECTEVANTFCDKCKTNLCEPCFDIIHNHKTLKSHNKIKVERFKHKTFFTKVCVNHKIPNEYFCENDNTIICSQCFIRGDHANHTVTIAKQKTESELGRLKAILERGNDVLSRLQLFKDDTREEQIRSKFKKDVTVVARMFDMYKAQLNECKKHAFDTLHKAYEDYGSKELSNKSKKLEDLSNLMEDARKVLKNTDHVVNIIGLTNELNNLINSNEQATDLREPKLEFKQNTKALFESLTKVIINEGTSKDKEQASNTSSSTPSNNSSTTDLTSDSQVNLNKKEKVSVTHLRNPSNFCVFLLKKKKVLAHLVRIIEKYIKNKPRKLTAKPKLGELYLSQYSLDKTYYRARIEEEFNDGSQICYRVLYIDFGNTEEVKLSSLIPLTEEQAKIEPLVKKCCLYQVSEDDKWSAEAIQGFAKSINDKHFEMEVFDIKDGVLYVDLKATKYGKVMSLNNIFAPMCNKKSNLLKKETPVAEKVPEKNETLLPSRIIKELPLKIGDTLEACIVHFESPFKFYVQLEINENISSTLFSQLQSIYSFPHYALQLTNPIEGMVCVANCSVGEQWYRAQITELSTPTTVVVKFLDLGILETVDISSLRKIQSEFLSIPPLAYCCYMADYTMTDEMDQTTCNKFDDYTRNENLFLTVLSRNQNETYGVSVLLGSSQRNVGELLQAMGYPLKPVMQEELQDGVEDEAEADPEPLDLDSRYKPINIVSSISPVNFFIKSVTKADKASYNQLMKQMSVSYDDSESELLEVEVGLIYAALSLANNMWHRVRVLNNLDNDYFEVLLLDSGSQEEVCLKNMRDLPSAFRETEFFAIQCHLKDILPSNDAETWSEESGQVLKTYQENRTVLYMLHNNDPEDGSIPVSLYDQEVTTKSENFKESTVKNFISIREILIDRGLAKPKMNYSGNYEVTNAFYKLKYKDASYPESSYLDVCPTHLDYEGDIYIQLTNSAEDIEKVNKELSLKTPSYELGYENIEYSTGQACVAKFTVDGRWYRAQVLNIHPDGIEVIFVDYGNNILITDPKDSLYPDFVCYDMPKLCFKCNIWNIMPASGTWSTPTLDFIHNLIVERPCSLEVVERPADGKPIRVNMYLPNGTSVADELTKNATAPSQAENEIATFPSLKIDTWDTLNVIVSHAGFGCTLFIQRMKVNNPETKLQHEINKIFADFSYVIEVMDNNDFAPLNEFEEYKLCCAKSALDESWYRASISKVNPTCVRVYYLDYGNMEDIPFENVRILPEELRSLPGQAILVKLYDIENNVEENVVSEQMIGVLMERDDLFAKVKSLGHIPEVEIVDREGTLVYQNLLDSNIIKRISDMDQNL